MNRPGVVDSSGWIEYFLDTSQADFFEPAILATEILIVPAIAIYEVHKRLSQLVPQEMVEQCVEVMQRGKVAVFDGARAIAASRIAQQYRLAMADAAMYAIAIEHDALLWTQDADYEGLPQVMFQAKV